MGGSSSVPVFLHDVRLDNVVVSELRKYCDSSKMEIIYLCEYGSRVKGYSGPDSDYDIRGIYHEKCLDDYLDKQWAFQPNNTEPRKSFSVEDRNGVVYDVELMHFKTAWQSFVEGTSTLYEWLLSPTIYMEIPTFTEFRLYILSKGCLLTPRPFLGQVNSTLNRFYRASTDGMRMKTLTLCWVHLIYAWAIIRGVDFALHVDDLLPSFNKEKDFSARDVRRLIECRRNGATLAPDVLRKLADDLATVSNRLAGRHFPLSLKKIELDAECKRKVYSIVKYEGGNQ